ncbi:MAG: uroporphyrinogen-III C-methyltransferase [bacterium]|nr:uroporphyrinogen-III C-methyltransferase [bacterium]
MNKGKVYLVGAGPGDVGLLTLKGLECVKKADVLIYDHLVNRHILSFAKDSSEIIYAGKSGKERIEQEEINHLLVNKALRGKVVVRLKGGDPFLFGRGGEEALFLVKNEVPFEVVPGIPSSLACPAYAGIPITHRKYSSSLAIITGHEDPKKEISSIPWDRISLVETLIILMGVRNLQEIVDRLIKGGRKETTPIAVIRWGTRNNQQTIVGTLRDIVEKARQITPPATIVVGDVVRLRKRLNWFEKRPLFGKGILVTRDKEGISELSNLLRSYGAQVFETPLIKILPPENFDGLDLSIDKLSEYNWIVFTSKNGVRYFLDRLRCKNRDIRELKGIRIACIGKKTSEEIERLGLIVDCQPKRYETDALIESLKVWNLKGTRILLPRADKARGLLSAELKKEGAEVTEVIAYRIVKEESVDEVKRCFKDRKIDVITFTSSTAVQNFYEIFRDKDINRLLKGVKVACIGPVTSKTAEDLGIDVHITPTEYTISGLVKAILKRAAR